MNVPQFRFDRFDGEWEQKELSELLEFKNGINADKDSYGHGAKFINVLDILNNDYILNEDIIGSVNATEQQLQTYSVTHGDILFLRSSETREDVGKCNVYLDEEKPAVFGGFVIRGKKIADYSPFFLKTLLNNSSARNQISSKAGGSTRYNVGQTILSEVIVRLPQIEEQQKISSFLMLFNQKIEKQQEKIEKLKQFKKGMMQKVFSQELRFKDEDGGEFPKWDSLQFGDVIEKLIGGGTPSRSVEEYYGGSIPWVTVKDLKTNKYVADAIDYITELGLKNSSSKIVDPGDLIIPTRMAVGRVLIATEKVAINQDLKGCKLKSGYDTEFIYYLYFSKSATIEKLASGSTVTGINIEQLMKIKIQVPILKEQEKIAGYLGSIDKKIDKEKEKLMVLEEQKKGFMCGMFV